MDIEFKEIFAGTDIGLVLDYTQRIAISPAIFLNFIFYNDSNKLEYEMDWGKMIAHIENGVVTERTTIGIYVDMKYVNETLININELDKKSDRA